MRVDPDTCRDADLLAAEVRRLQAAIAAGEPTLTDAEREAVESAVWDYEQSDDDEDCARMVSTLRGLLERLK